MKLLTVIVLFLISTTKLNGQQPCCIQRVLLTPTSTVYVNIGAQNVMTPTKNQQYDAPIYQNPYGYQSQQQGINGNTLIGTGPVVTSTQKPSTTVTSFAITNAVPWNGNQTGYADEGTLRQILRDQEYNGDNNNTNVNETSQSTTQNLNLYYQGVNGSWGNTNNSNTFENSNNLSNNNTAGMNNNWTTSSSQNGNIINTDDITTNEFSDSGYIQVAGALGTVDMTESGKAIEDQKPYQGTTSGGLELQQTERAQPSSASTVVYHNTNANFSSGVQTQSTGNNYNSTDSNLTSNNAGLGGIGIGGIGSTNNNNTNNSTVVNISSSTFEDADIAPTTHDSDYKYSDSGYITVGIVGDNTTTTNQSGNGDISSSNVNNESDINSSIQGTTPQQTINNDANLLQSTQSTQNEVELPIQDTQMGVELSTQSEQFNQEVTLNEGTLNNESTVNYTNNGTIDVTNENIDDTTITSTLLRDSTQNDEDNVTKVNDSSMDVTTLSQNSSSKNTSFLLSIILVLLFIMFN